MLVTGADVQEVIVGAVTDQTFGKIVAFGLGGVLVEVLKDVTFRLAPTSPDEARSMVDGISAHEMLNGVRGAKPVDKDAIADRSSRGCRTWSRTSRSSPRWTSTRCSPGRTARPRSTSGSSWTPRPASRSTGTARRRS